MENLVNGDQNAGFHDITWSASNLSSGLYIIHFNAGNHSDTQKIMFIK